MDRRKLRLLVVDGHSYLYRAGMGSDRDGERVISVVVLHADADRPGRPRGMAARARFLARAPTYPVNNTFALPADVRAVLDRALAQGWDGRHELWLSPDDDLQRPSLVLSGRDRLFEWSKGGPLYVVTLEGVEAADEIASTLEVPLLTETRRAAEVQWRDERRYVLRSRWGRIVTVHTRTVAELVATMRALRRHDPALAVWVRALPARSSPRPDAPRAMRPAEHWATHPGAVRHRGPRENDVVWSLSDPDGPGVEAYFHHADPPDRLWTWLSLREGSSMERRFPLG